MSPRINLIVAYAKNRVIGKNNCMPWHLPEDLAHFKRTTLGATVIMGRKTWDSIGRPLPGRRNLVVSRDPLLKLHGAEVVHSLEEALAQCQNEADVFVIGGAQIYTQALPLAQRLVVTEIDHTFEGDASFPEIDFSQWQEKKRELHQAHSPNTFSFSIVEYQRRPCP